MIRTPVSTAWNEYGREVTTNEPPTSMRGVIQPLGSKLLQLEGGRYTMDDRVIYSTQRLAAGDVIEYHGMKYTIDGVDDRAEYHDVFKYMAKRVSTYDSV